LEGSFFLCLHAKIVEKLHLNYKLEDRKHLPMKCTYLLIFLLFSYHLNAQETKEQAKKIPTTRVDQKSMQEDSISTIFTIAEQMPMFRDSSCLKLTSRGEQKTCTDKKLIFFLLSNINYSDSLRQTGLAATVIISFVVETDGSLSNFQILRDNDNPTFAQECIRVTKLTVEKNGPWIPASQRGQAIPLRMKLPFRLNLR
jgi:outer membrane biosynthesis protein TonB